MEALSGVLTEAQSDRLNSDHFVTENRIYIYTDFVQNIILRIVFLRIRFAP